MVSASATQFVSSTIGWSYMLCWTASFYPQFLLNITRRTTHGFSIDFALLNALGMASYAAYNIVFLASPVVREEYKDRFPHGRPPSDLVRANDVAYAVHGAIITVLIYSQFCPPLWNFSRDNESCCSRITLAVFGVSIGAVLLLTIAASFNLHTTWLDLIFLLGNIKAILTLIKFAPQVWLNFCRKSTRGLSLSQFNLDIAGALLSLMQLAIDSGGELSAAIRNPAKFALANVTILFDLIFLFQALWLYRGTVDSSWVVVEEAGEIDPLLPQTAHGDNGERR